MVKTARPLRILHALCSDRKGGLEQAFVNTATALDALGHQVINLTPETAPYLAQTPQHLPHHAFQPRGFFDVAEAWRMRRFIKQQKPDVLVAHNSRAVQILHWARLGLKVPLIGFSHGNKTARVKKADYVVALTPAMKERYIAAGVPAENIFIFPNMMPHLPEAPLPKPTARGNLLQLGFVGRLASEKGLEDLLAALALLKERGQEFSLAIAGSGKDDALIHARAQDLGIAEHLTFSGWVDNIGAWLQGIEVAVFPSRYETFGIVVLEAHAYGRVVVSTATDGPKSQIEDGVTGFLAQPQDPESLAETLLRAEKARPQWPEMVARGFKQAQNHSLNALMPRLEDIVQHVARKL